MQLLDDIVTCIVLGITIAIIAFILIIFGVTWISSYFGGLAVQQYKSQQIWMNDLIEKIKSENDTYR